MVNVETVRMDVSGRLVAVRMRVLAARVRGVFVAVVKVVVRVRMIVLNGTVSVLVLVGFR